MQFFSEDLSATQTTRLVGVRRKTVDDWFKTFRTALAEFQEEQVQQSSREFELDESYFGEPRKKLHAQDRRKRSRGAENKVPVLASRNETMARYTPKS